MSDPAGAAPQSYNELNSILRRTREDCAEVHLLYTAIGRAIVALSEVELELCLLFMVCRLPQNTETTGKFIAAQRQISEKIKVLNLVIEVTRSHEECLQWQELKKRIEHNKDIRNRLAHEGIEIVGVEGGPIEAVLSASPLGKAKAQLNEDDINAAADALEELKKDISDFAWRLGKRDYDDAQDSPYDD
ncbi:hypothetical protein [Methylorubrum extorquens]|uniref:hypothetical protein n=1 Tax=Methylorubrum extorquens TaxID=408 RepID=UPI001EE53959|nr:hypothetical protein [Methylorubrum extorquens]MCG5249612.1 hypothetical protein [Methylorubrum extorquens]